ncbi:MAG: mannose-1-phosphate guanylyltransferase [Balneolaceae bacterium]|nr:MAG: mannose-1-phosphate guanylyltransferase [Balneolaceae bacterium]
MNIAVIMAGGAGTRFWPKSTKEKPKQFLRLFGKKSLIQQTVERLSGFIDEKNVIVITNNDYVHLVNRQLPNLDSKYIIGEPLARNTAPCIASAAALLYRDNPEAIMVVLPADHRIAENDRFLKVIKSASQTAAEKNSLVTIGIEPNRPETGYGYIRREAAPVATFNNQDVYRVKNFTEKPELARARDFLKSGDYLWNSGIFIWKVSAIVDAFRQYLPEIFEQMEKLASSEKKESDINTFYHKCPSISIDYGIMEKAEHVHVVPASFGWNDVGSWKAVHELADKDEAGNAIGDSTVILQDASGNLVDVASGKTIALVGVDNVAVVETDDAILVLNLDKAQDVKEVVDEIDRLAETE